MQDVQNDGGDGLDARELRDGDGDDGLSWLRQDSSWCWRADFSV